MKFYQFDISDYQASTKHLCHEEHYIYRTLIDTYMEKELPLTLEKRVLLRRLGLTIDQMPLLEAILDDFFEALDDGYHNTRCDREIRTYHGFIKRQTDKGIASGKARRAKKKKGTTVEPRLNTGSATVEPALNRNEPKIEIEIEIEKESKPKKNGRFAPPTPAEVQTYLNEKGITAFTGERFVAHYEAVNWYRGKNKIKSWKACVTTWVGNRDDKPESPYGLGAI